MLRLGTRAHTSTHAPVQNLFSSAACSLESSLVSSPSCSRCRSETDCPRAAREGLVVTQARQRPAEPQGRLLLWAGKGAFCPRPPPLFIFTQEQPLAGDRTKMPQNAPKCTRRPQNAPKSENWIFGHQSIGLRYSPSRQSYDFPSTTTNRATITNLALQSGRRRMDQRPRFRPRALPGSTTASHC